MPVILWNPALALEWIHSPSQKLKEHIASDSSSDHIGTAWQPVSKRMSNVRYQGNDCKKSVKLEKVPSISSFFGQSHNARRNGEVDKKVPCLNQSTSQMDCNLYESKLDHKRPMLLSLSGSCSKKARGATSQAPSTVKYPPQCAVTTGTPMQRRGQITSLFVPKDTKRRPINQFSKGDMK